MKVLAAVDKFKGTATAPEVARAIGHACWTLGHDCVELPLADGGDGLLDVYGGPNRRTTATGPLGRPVEVEWRLQRGTAVIETARVAGLVLVGGPDGNDPLGATTTGVGELMLQAVAAGARRIVVGLGGSATTDGGLGAVEAVGSPARLRGAEIVVACDVSTRFRDAARVFAPQKGATPAQVDLLARRLDRLAQRYRTELGVDVDALEHAGAAGGLAGGLAALGARLVSGFDLVADDVDLVDHLRAADLVVTGEGHLDATSFEGKVVGGVVELAAEVGVDVRAVVGDADPDVRDRIDLVTLVELVGAETAWREPLRSIEAATLSLLSRSAPTTR
ncbi:MAG: glycerate kinase [Ilumatobacteraceae bacterium]|nr:glycerate kinase [Ilumatobacteraceae bacterium]